MRHAWAVREATDEVLETSGQLGVKDIVVYAGPGWPYLPGTAEPQSKPRATYEDYMSLIERLDKYGLRVAAIEGGFVHLDPFRDLPFGGPDRDALIERIGAEIQDMARAGIPVFGYHWLPNGVWRTADKYIRSGARVTAFDADHETFHPTPHDPIPDDVTIIEEGMWANLEYWIKAITPVAEEAGIRLGIHPDDPPVPELGGVPRILRSFEAYKRLIEIVDSPANAIEFCQGTFSEMADAANGGIYEMIDYFTRRDKILYVHFRNVSGQVPRFNEEFLNAGYVDMHRAMETYNEAGYSGVFMDDHCPVLTHDEDFPGNWGGYRSRIFAQGYIQAMIESVTGRRPEER